MIDSLKVFRMAFSKNTPEKGRGYECVELKMQDGEAKVRTIRTSIVKDVSHIGDNIYKVETCNSIYFVNVG